MQPDDMPTPGFEPALVAATAKAPAAAAVATADLTPDPRRGVIAVVVRTSSSPQEFVVGPRRGERARVAVRGDKDGPDGTLDEFAVPDGGVQADALREAVLEDDEGVVVPVVYDSAVVWGRGEVSLFLFSF